jgi:hypothetical protein
MELDSRMRSAAVCGAERTVRGPRKSEPVSVKTLVINGRRTAPLLDKPLEDVLKFCRLVVFPLVRDLVLPLPVRRRRPFLGLLLVVLGMVGVVGMI